MYMYQQGFNFFHLGYASSIGYVLFVVIAAVTALQFRLLRNG
jgi:multiple sugar transport system permease protein